VHLPGHALHLISTVCPVFSLDAISNSFCGCGFHSSACMCAYAFLSAATGAGLQVTMTHMSMVPATRVTVVV